MATADDERGAAGAGLGLLPDRPWLVAVALFDAFDGQALVVAFDL